METQAKTGYRQLLVWQQAVELSVAVYRVTADFPVEERYGLTSQMRKAAGSIAANIAEGPGRGTRKDFAQFVSVAIGSLRELETHYEIALQLQLLEPNEEIAELCENVGKLLIRLRQSMKSD